MKIILSRKGFDSSNGGCASPILPDGTLLSMPIPGESTLLYSDISFNSNSYEDIWKRLSPKNYKGNLSCHLDPDIRSDIRINLINKWQPAYGQVDKAQSHLEDQGVDIGDLFLFFGWFQETREDKPFVYKKGAAALHTIYGYMQIGEIIKDGEEIAKRVPWHPHASEPFLSMVNNTIYLPSSELVINGEKTGLKGYGTFNFNENLVLTAPGMSRSKWKIFDWMNEANISFHSKSSIHDNYLQSAMIGQEFVICNSDKAVSWAKEVILNNILMHV